MVQEMARKAVGKKRMPKDHHHYSYDDSVGYSSSFRSCVLATRAARMHVMYYLA